MNQGILLDLHWPRNGPCNAYFRGPWPNFNGPKNFWAKDNLTKNFMVDLFISTLIDLWCNTDQKGLENGVRLWCWPNLFPMCPQFCIMLPQKRPLPWLIKGERWAPIRWYIVPYSSPPISQSQFNLGDVSIPDGAGCIILFHMASLPLNKIPM